MLQVYVAQQGTAVLVGSAHWTAASASCGPTSPPFEAVGLCGKSRRRDTSRNRSVRSAAAADTVTASHLLWHERTS
jgi:hypothetical protein